MNRKKISKSLSESICSYYSAKQDVKSFISEYTPQERFYKVSDIIESLQKLTGSFFCGIYNYIPQKTNYILVSSPSRTHIGNDNFLYQIRYILQKSENQETCCFGNKKLFVNSDASLTIPIFNDTNLTIKHLQNLSESYATFPTQTYDMLDSAKISYITFNELSKTFEDWERITFYKEYSRLIEKN